MKKCESSVKFIEVEYEGEKNPVYYGLYSFSRFKWNDLELPLDLYNGDKVIASRKVGKNIWDEQWEVGGYNTSNGTKYEDNNRIRSKNYISVAPNSNIYYSSTNQNGTLKICEFNSSNGFLRTVYLSINNTFVVPQDCYYIAISTNSSLYGGVYNHDIMICLASEVDKTYEPYLKNKVWEYKVKGSVDLGSLNYSYDNTTYAYPYFIATISPTPLGSQLSALSNKYKCATFSNIANVSGYNLHFAFTGAGQLRIRHEEMKTVDSFKNANVGTKLIYELAQPQWIDLTETHSQLLHDLTPNATQEISVDNGQVKVSYYKAKE